MLLSRRLAVVLLVLMSWCFVRSESLPGSAGCYPDCGTGPGRGSWMTRCGKWWPKGLTLSGDTFFSGSVRVSNGPSHWAGGTSAKLRSRKIQMPRGASSCGIFWCRPQLNVGEARSMSWKPVETLKLPNSDPLQSLGGNLLDGIPWLQAAGAVFPIDGFGLCCHVQFHICRHLQMLEQALNNQLLQVSLICAISWSISGARAQLGFQSTDPSLPRWLNEFTAGQLAKKRFGSFYPCFFVFFWCKTRRFPLDWLDATARWTIWINKRAYPDRQLIDFDGGAAYCW